MARTTTLLLVFTFFAFALMIVAFVTPEWQTETEESDDGLTTTRTAISLQGFSRKTVEVDGAGEFQKSLEIKGPLELGTLTVITKTPTSEKVETISPPNSQGFYKAIGSLLADSVTARDGVIGTGVPAMALGLGFLICFSLARKGKGPSFCGNIGLLLVAATVVFVFIGVFLYSKVLDVGICLVIWTGFCIFAALVGCFIAEIGATGGRKRYMSLLFWCMALLLGVIALAVPYWMSESREVFVDAVPDYIQIDSKYSGVDAYGEETRKTDLDGNTLSSFSFDSRYRGDTFTTVRVQNGKQTRNTYTKCPDTPKEECGLATQKESTSFAPFKKGADEILGCGVLAMLFMLVCGLGLLALHKNKRPRVMRLITVGCAFAAAAFGLLGLILYSAQTSVGYSFILYSAAGFCWVFVFVLAVYLANPSSERMTLLGK